MCLCGRRIITGAFRSIFPSDWVPDLECNKDRPDDQFKPYGATPGHGIEWARLITQWALSTYKEDKASAAPYLEAAQNLYNRAVSDAWNADGAPGIVYTTDWNGKPWFMTECTGRWQKQSILPQCFTE